MSSEVTGAEGQEDVGPAPPPEAVTGPGEAPGAPAAPRTPPEAAPPRSRAGLAGARFLLHLLDAPLLFAVFLAAYQIRFHSGWLPAPVGDVVPPLAGYARTFALLSVGWVAFLWAAGFYQRPRFGVPGALRLAGLLTMAGGLTLALFFFRRDFSYSRLTIVLAFTLAWAGLTLFHVLKEALFLALMRRGYGRAPALVVGPPAFASAALARLADDPYLGLDLVGIAGPEVDPEAEEGAGVDVAMAPTYFASPRRSGPEGTGGAVPPRRLGGVAEVPGLCARHGVQEIFVAYPMTAGREMMEVLRLCEDTTAAVRVVPDVFGLITHGVQMRLVGGLPVLEVGRSPFDGVEGWAKRVLDVVLSALGLLALSPFLALVALGVRRSSPGPIFYTQERVGLDGNTFQIYKFRSMPVDAEKETGPVWAQASDPRATGFGRFIRKWSIDELPQLFNVLVGDMSLVGPRPERPFFVQKFRQDVRGYMQRHRVKAGITGWAQINGLRGKAPIEDRTRYDVWYIENWSLALDVEILLRTIWVCLTRPEG